MKLKMKWISQLLVLALLLTLSSAVLAEDVSMAIRDDSQNVQLGVLTAGGGMIGVTFNESSDSGYVWKTSADCGLNMVMDEVMAQNEAEIMLGLPSQHSYVFIAGSQSEGELSFYLAKTWIHGYPAAYEVTVPYYTDNYGMITVGGAYVEKNVPIPDTVEEQMASDPAYGSITFKKEVYELFVGKMTTVTPQASSYQISKKGYQFTSSDESVATVNSEGRVKGIAQGQCTILVKSLSDENVWARFVVKVLQPVSKVTVSAPAETMGAGETMQLTAIVEPANADNPSVKWTSSDKTIATVDENGVVTALKKGSVTITARSLENSDLSGRCKLEVTQAVTGVTVENEYVRVGVNYYVNVTAKIQPSNANNKNMTWYSSDESIATVTGSKTEAKITGKAWGTCTVTGVTEEGNYTCTVTVLVGSLSKAVTMTNTRLNYYGAPEFTLQNNSNIVMKKISFAFRAYDYNGEPMVISGEGDGLTLYADYNTTLYPGAVGSSMDLQYVRKLYNNWDGVARVEAAITGWESLYTYPTTKGTESNHYTLSESGYNWVGMGASFE